MPRDCEEKEMLEGEYKVDESFGGEVEEFINKVKDKQYRCVGCGDYHVAKRFIAIKGEDSGLSDKNGIEHWVFVRCTKRLAYDNAFWKVLKNLKKETLAN